MMKRPSHDLPIKEQIEEAQKTVNGPESTAQNSKRQLPEYVQKTLESPKKKFKASQQIDPKDKERKKNEPNIITNHVNSDKIKEIHGMRDSAQSQRAVMGGVSATEASELSP
jgi:hypothetical protein